MRTLKERLQQGECVNICAVGRVFHYNLIQMLGMSGGFDGVWFDLEHVGNAMENLEIGTMACRSVGMDSFVRIPPTDYGIVSRSLECGSSGVMAAQIRTVEQAKQFVTWSKFYPEGCRGLNNGGYDAGFGKLGLAEYCEQGNKNTLILLQIETAEAVECCEELAAIPGVDMLFVGPADLSQNLGVAGQFFHEKCLSAIRRVGAACKSAGKTWGVVPNDAEHAQFCYDNGCRMFSVASDVRLLNLGLQGIKQKFPKRFE